MKKIAFDLDGVVFDSENLMDKDLIKCYLDYLNNN